MRVAVAGGTGVVGRLTVSALARAGHDPVVLARSHGVDLTAGAGLDRALAGVGAVIDTCNRATLNRSVAVDFFTATTTHLLAAAGRAGVGHLVVLSIVGIDRVDTGYYAGKRRQEELALAGPLPVTVLRATQFHEFAGQLLAQARGPVALVPRMRIRPVAAHEVAERLAVLAVGPVVSSPELGGPEVHELPDLARRLVASRRGAQGRRTTRVLGVPVPGRAGRAMASGALLPAGAVTLGRVTFDEWLAESQGESPADSVAGE